MELAFSIYLWIILGIVFFISEIFTGTFYLLFSGIAAFLTAICVWIFGLQIWISCLVFAALSVIGALLVQKRVKTESKGFDNDQHRLLTLSEDMPPRTEKSISYQGSTWTAFNESTKSLKAGDKIKIIKIQGIKLIVGPADL